MMTDSLLSMFWNHSLGHSFGHHFVPQVSIIIFVFSADGVVVVAGEEGEPAIVVAVDDDDDDDDGGGDDDLDSIVIQSLLLLLLLSWGRGSISSTDRSITTLRTAPS